MLKRKLYPAYFSKHNLIRKKQGILLMIPNGEKRKDKSKGREAEYERKRQHYLAVKNISAVLRRITSKNNCDFYCLNSLEQNQA